MLFIGVIAKCALFVEELRSCGRQERLWNIGGGLTSLSLRCASYLEWKVQGPSPLESPWNPSWTVFAPAGTRAHLQREAFSSNHLHSLPWVYCGSEDGHHPLPASVTVTSNGSIGRNVPWLRLLSVVSISGTVVLTHWTSWFLGSLLLFYIRILCFSSPCLTYWILLSVFISDHE